MAGKTVKYVPNKRLDIIAIDPFDGKRVRIRNFDSNLGTNWRFWFIRK